MLITIIVKQMIVWRFLLMDYTKILEVRGIKIIDRGTKKDLEDLRLKKLISNRLKQVFLIVVSVIDTL